MANNSFSLDRLSLLWQFYTPSIRRHWLWEGIALIIAYALAFAGTAIANTGEESLFGWGILLFTGGMGLAGCLYYIGPLMFAFCRTRLTATVLPASWVEKTVFFLGYTIIVYPLFLALIWYAATGLLTVVSPMANVNASMIQLLDSLDSTGISLQTFTNRNWYSSVVSSMTTMACCAFGVLYSRRNRLAMGLVGILMGWFVNFACGLTVSIFSMANTSFMRGLADGYVGNPAADVEDFPNQLMANMQDYIVVCSAAEAVVVLAVLVLCVIKIRNRQN